MAAHPSARLAASRGLLQREFEQYQAAAGAAISYGSDVAAWLVAQLPGADPTELGWGIIAVTALLCPDADSGAGAVPGQPGERSGERTSMLLASRVGEALVGSARPAAWPCGAAHEVGPELARLDMSGVYTEFSGLPSSSAATADPAQLRREFHRAMAGSLGEIRQRLAGELSGADLPAIGWSLIGTGMCLLAQTGRIPPPRRPWPGARRRGTFRASAMRSALFLAAVGDYLIIPAA